MVEFTFNVSDVRVAAAIREKGPKIHAALSRKLQYLMLLLQQRIQGKLSGAVLQQRSGRLRNSVRVEPVQSIGATMLQGSVQAAGGPAWYGVVHEMGGRGSYVIRPVNKKALAFFPSGATGEVTLRSGRTISSKEILRNMANPKSRLRGFQQFKDAGGVVVKSVVHPPLPQRSFAATSLEEMAEDIVSEIQNTVRAEVAV